MRTSRRAPPPRRVREREGAPGRSTQTLGPRSPVPASKKAWGRTSWAVRSSSWPARVTRQAAREEAQAGRSTRTTARAVRAAAQNAGFVLTRPDQRIKK